MILKKLNGKIVDNFTNEPIFEEKEMQVIGISTKDFAKLATNDELKSLIIDKAAKPDYTSLTTAKALMSNGTHTLYAENNMIFGVEIYVDTFSAHPIYDAVVGFNAKADESIALLLGKITSIDTSIPATWLKGEAMGTTTINFLQLK